MNYEHDLTEIAKLRREAYSLDLPIIIVCGLGIASAYITPMLAPVFGIGVGWIFYKKLMRAAHAPCPKCKQPYGTSSKWPIGVGVNHCQNCKLELYKNAL